MNWVDFFIGVVLILTISLGYKRGMFKELTTFLGLVIGAIIAVNYADWLAAQAEGAVNISPSLRYVFALIICFAASLLIFKLIGYYFYKMVKLSQLGTTDKLGGAVFGAFKGGVILSLLFLMFIFLPMFQSFNQSIDESAMAPYIRQFVPEAFELTEYFHPNSGTFMKKVTNGILGDQAIEYAKNPESLFKADNVYGYSLEDQRVMNNIDKYFGEKVEVATKAAEDKIKK
jgi:membrane protein required for colicin V production